MSIIIDPEFQSLIPPLSTDEYTQLEKNIVKDGIRDALIVWPQGDGNSILIDGHNRFRISTAHAGIRFEIKQKNFKDRDEAIVWIVENQLGKRNLPLPDKVILQDKKRDALARMADKKQKAGIANPDKNSCQGSKERNAFDRKNKTDYKIAKAAGTSEDTVRKVRTIKEKSTPETWEQVRSGEISINQAYRQIKADEIPPQKTLRQKQNEAIHEAKERHSDYQQKKSEGIVSIQDARQDKQDRKRIAEELYNDLLSITTKSYWISALNTASDFDALADVIPDDRKQSMKDRIGKMMNVLNKVMEVLDESKIRR